MSPAEEPATLLAQWDRYRESERDAPHTGYVYFIRVRERGPVKIGYTESRDGVERRLKSLQTGNPHRLRVQAVVPGSRLTEAMLHWCFVGHSLEGEWFKGKCDCLNALIAHLHAADCPTILGDVA